MKNPEDRWVRVYGRRNCWGVKIRPGMRKRDLPSELQVAATPQAGALHPIEFRGGSFFFLNWKQHHPLHWPEPDYVELFPGDYIVELDTGELTFIRGQAA